MVKKEFHELVQKDYDQQYLDTIPAEFREFFQQAFAQPSIKKMLDFLSLRPKELTNEKFHDLSNSFMLGVGNPNSEILVVGKEQAFDKTTVDLLIKENITNFRQWKEVAKNNWFETDPKELLETIGFNPLIPPVYHFRNHPTGRTKGNHTWSKVCRVLKAAYPESTLTVDEQQNRHRSLFNRCFFTELNHRPAKIHEGSGLAENRRKLLQEPFFRSFPIVIFTAKSYISGEPKSFLEGLYGSPLCDPKTIELGKKGKMEIPITITRYKSPHQTIYLCNQLSGSAGWTNVSLENFGLKIQEVLATKSEVLK